MRNIEPVAHKRREARTELDQRFDEVLSERGWDSDAEWSRAAGLSLGYVKQQRHQAAHSDAYRLPEGGAEKLAAAAGVSVEWLRFGRGPRRPGSAKLPEAPAPEDSALPTAHLLRSLLVAWRRSDSDPEDYEAIARVLRSGAGQLGAESEEELAQVLARWLVIARRLRNAGREVSFASLAFESARRARDFEANDEGRRELENLGAEPPARPISVPPVRPRS